MGHFCWPKKQIRVDGDGGPWPHSWRGYWRISGFQGGSHSHRFQAFLIARNTNLLFWDSPLIMYIVLPSLYVIWVGDHHRNRNIKADSSSGLLSMLRYTTSSGQPANCLFYDFTESSGCECHASPQYCRDLSPPGGNYPNYHTIIKYPENDWARGGGKVNQKYQIPITTKLANTVRQQIVH